jgi:PAS domain S-box-containing protein
MALPTLTVIPDAQRDTRFARDELASFRFYAGVPLQTDDGEPVGTLCVVDRVVRALEPHQAEILQLLAVGAVGVLRRHQAEQRYAAAPGSFHSMLEFAPDAIVGIDSAQTVVHYNAAAAKMFGRPVADAIGRPLTDFLPARFRASHIEHVRRFARTDGQPRAMHSSGRLFGLRANGDEFPVEASISCTSDEGTRLFTAVLRDVSERTALESQLQARTAELHRANAELREASLQLGTAQQLTNVGSWSFEVLTGKVSWSRQLFRIVGVEESACAFPFEQQDQLYEPESWKRLAAAVSRALEDGAPYELELELAPRDGVRRWAVARGEPQLLDGRVVRLVGTLQDVSALKRAHLELEQASKMLQRALSFQRAIVDASGMSIISTDCEGRIETFNRMAEQLLGYKEEEILGLTPAQFHKHDEVAARAHELSAQQSRTIEPGFEAFVSKARTGQVDQREWTYVRKDGQELPVLLSVTALRAEDGDLFGFLGVAADVTELRRTRERLEFQKTELQRSNEELQQFAYVASHDLQEPLRAVAGCAQLLQKSYRGRLDTSADELIQHVVEGCERMRALIHDLLALSRVSSNTRTPTRADAAVACRAALTNLAAAIQESGASIDVQELPIVIADTGQLVQLFQNLVGNALKYRSERRPEVQIRSERRDNDWLFCVRDNGIGIESRYFDRIFGLFQRLHSRRDYAGTGIGLTICKKVVQRHRGEIWLESTPGVGSAFFFTIPHEPWMLTP